MTEERYEPGKKCSVREGEIDVKHYMKSDWFTFAVLFLRVSSVNRVMRGIGSLTLENRTFLGAAMQMQCK